MSPMMAILVREWQDVLANKAMLVAFAIMIFATFGVPSALAFGGPELLGDSWSMVESDPMAQVAFQQLGVDLPTPREQFQAFMLRQVSATVLLLPVLGALSLATWSVAGERRAGTLEALLASPLTGRQILTAKCLATALPAVLLTWLLFVVFAVLTHVIAGPAVAAIAFDAGTWTAIGSITPLLALFGLGLGVVVSSRVRDPRGAHQLAMVIVMPLVLLLGGVSSGLISLGPTFVFGGALLLAVLDGLLLLLGGALFDREQLLTRS